jgi:hypothetical protein
MTARPHQTGPRARSLGIIVQSVDIKPYYSHSARGLASRERSLISVCAENQLRYYVLVSYPSSLISDSLCRSSPLFLDVFDVSFRLDIPMFLHFLHHIVLYALGFFPLPIVCTLLRYLYGYCNLTSP